jgi:hypothetical protein
MTDWDYEQARNLQNAVSASILTLVSRTMQGRDKPNDKESKRKMSVSRKKHIMTPEHKANIGKAAKGRVLSEESRRKISEAMKGRTQTEEHRRKNSEAAKRRYANVHSATD